MIHRLAPAIVLQPADPLSPPARACIEAYYAELDRRFPNGFDPGAFHPQVEEKMTPPKGLFLVAWRKDQPVGCGGLAPLDGRCGEVKRVWVAEAARGMGLARRLMAALEDAARDAGHSMLRLDTNETLTEAHALYAALGYHEIAAYNDNPYAGKWFEKTL
ncbi:MAG TPA: GNAT family N-acetyltransferase [Rhizobiaceae bacterium]|nr:GNAT family N-acetyltransferase [Rhizobiaceae bacterium]